MKEITIQKTQNEPKRVHCSIPKFLLNNPVLQNAIKKCLPENYNFEVYKCIDIILKEKYKNIVLQLPEGLLIWGLYLSEIFYFFCDSVEEVIILGDVTYGACCVDDFTSSKLNADLIIHYGHSCLIPLTTTRIRCLYVFVDIKLKENHLVETIKKNFQKNEIILLLGTIQFSCMIHKVHSILKKENHFDTFLPIPQVLPLTKGEVLGCTSPNLYQFLYEHVIRKDKQESNETQSNYEEEVNENHVINECRTFLKKNSVKIIFIADGRFHLESLMIHNPDFLFYRYNPFDKVITKEDYNYPLFYEIRKSEIKKCVDCRNVCIILSTLGRQGNVNILRNIVQLIKEKNLQFFILLVSEIFTEKLKLFKNVDLFIQIGCPRLSIDWGNYNFVPLLNSYEAYVLLKQVKYKDIYPMDYFANSGGKWSNYHAGIGDNNEKNLSIKEIIRRRIQMKRNKLNIRYE